MGACLWGCGCVEGPDEEADNWGKWVDNSVAIREQLEMPTLHTPWIDSHELQGVSRKARHLELISVGYYACTKEYPFPALKEGVKKWHCMLDQSIKRMPWGDMLDCIGQKSLPYSYHFDRVYDAEDCGMGWMEGMAGWQGLSHVGATEAK